MYIIQMILYSRHLAIGFGFFRLQTEPVSLHLRILERFWIATAVCAHEEISEQRVSVGSVFGLGEVALLCCFSELSVVPVGDSQPPSFTVDQVAG